MDNFDDSINKDLFKRICNNEIDYKSFQGATFWHFVSVETLKKIFPISESSCVLYGSSLEELNDLEECNSIKDAERIFVICFSQNYSIHKAQLPMWFFYSEPDGRGVAFGITPKGMFSFIQECTNNLVIGLNAGSSIRRINNIHITPDDYEVKCGWVSYYYQAYKSNKYDSQGPIVTFRNTNYKSNGNLPLKESNLVKSSLWSYENEFRIIITLTEDAYNRIQRETKSGKIKIGLDLSGISKRFLRLAYSPKLDDTVVLTDMPKEYFGKTICVEELKFVNLKK